MAHPYHHALSSVRTFGGAVEDYLPLHSWMDATKAHLVNFRHRAVRHHKEAIPLLCRELKSNTIISQGEAVSIQALAEQHIKEDCLSIVSLSDWLEGYKNPIPTHAGKTWNPVKNWGGAADDYTPIQELFESYHPLQLHHSQGIFQVESILGITIVNSMGRIVLVRTLCEEYLKSRYLSVPTLEQMVTPIRFSPWMLKTEKIESTL